MNINRRNFVLAGSATAAASLAWPSLKAFAATQDASSTPRPLPAHLMFGVDYYPDQTPEHLWQQDAAEMQAYGVNSVRIAEFAWALMEPSEGVYQFDWLHRAIDLLHAHGISVILGTPSAAPPPWLSQKYPEVLMVNAQGISLHPGARRFTCPTNAAYRKLSTNIATHMAKEFASTPGVVGWQIDNEFTLASTPLCYCKYCQGGFQKWLQQKYGTLKNLNEKWGTVFWSNTYTDFSQIPVPLPSGAPPNPGLALDYRRYQTHAYTTFQQDQLDVLRRLCPHHFITTNNVGGLVDNIDLRELYQNLDFVAADNYPGFMAIMAGGNMPPVAMANSVNFMLDYVRGVKRGEPFFIMEQQTGKAGQPTFAPQPEPGQLRLWSYQTIAHGAFGIQYFRWDTTTFGAEEYWHGILQHDRQPSPGFAEIKQTIRELKSLGLDALHAHCDASIALLYDSDSDWALDIQPGQPQFKYSGQMLDWYAPLAASQSGVDLVDGIHDLSQYKVLCAPAMYIVSPEQAEAIRAFVQQGGIFLAGFRLGVKDPYSRIVRTPLPGLLTDVMGTEVYDYEPIYSQPQNVAFSGPLAGPNAKCSIWADILKPGPNAQVLATYLDRQYKGRPAITSHNYGKGRAIYLGAGLQGEDMARVLTTLLASAEIQPRIHAAPGVEITSRSADAKRWTYLLNHTADTQPVRLDRTYQANGSPVSGTIHLPPYGVKVLLS
ncbi:MAG: beta-galactosidase [Acidobacteriaceae bacterium]